jgi:hypothetical protein
MSIKYMSISIIKHIKNMLQISIQYIDKKYFPIYFFRYFLYSKIVSNESVDVNEINIVIGFLPV